MTDNKAQPQSTIDEQGDSKSPQLGEQPEQVKSLTVDEAYRRGVIDATGGLAIPSLMNHQKSRNTAFKKYAIKFFNTKIRERRERLLGALVNDLATSDLACNSGVTNPQQIAQEAKAFGGCRNCYGKGYATVISGTKGYADFGGDGFQTPPTTHIKYCSCDRGKQLQQVVAQEANKAIYGFHEYIMGKDIIRTEADQAFNYARLHRALDDYIASLTADKDTK